jgi:hypothetical protein
MIINNRAMSCQQRAMTRKPRIEYPRALLNVIVRGNNRQEIFHDDGYRRAYRERLGLYLAEGRVTSILLTVESRRQETAGYAPGPGENTLEGRGLVPAVSGGAVLGVGGLHRAFEAHAAAPTMRVRLIKVASERRGVYCMGDSPPRRGSSSMAPKRAIHNFA